MPRILAALLLALTVGGTSAALPADAPERKLSLEIDSALLEETRAFRVRLPEGYFEDSGRRYPVFYVSDADWNFELVADTLEYHAYWGRLPDFIVVGALNVSRNRDFVPRADPFFPETGEGDRYVRHLSEELIPIVDGNWRTSEVRILFGHSFGGVLALNQLFSEPGLFDAYVALGASVWVAERVMFERARAAFEARPGMTGRLYLAVGEGDGGATVPDGERFAELLEQSAPDGLEWVFHIHPRENHFTNVPYALHDALAWLYPFWGLDETLIEAGRAAGPQGVADWYDAREAELGWRFVPQSMELGLAGVTLAREGRLEAAEAIFDRLEARYPQRPEVFAMHAQARFAAGDHAGADAAIARAIALGEQVGHPSDRLQAFRNFREALTPEQ